MTDTTARRWRPTARTVPLMIALAVAISAALAGCGGSSSAVGTSGSTPTVKVIVHHRHRSGESRGHHASQARAGAAKTHGSGAAKTHGAGSASGTTATAAAAASTRTSTTGAQSPATAAPTAPKGHASAAVAPTTIAVVTRAVELRSAPAQAGHGLGQLATRTQFGSDTAVPIIERRGSWLGVRSLLAGNGRIGWIPRSAVSLSQTEWRIYVSIDSQRITVSYGNRIVRRFRTSTGVEGASTPTGHFAVTDRLRTGVEQGPYGCCILALSAVQPRHLSDWDGGNRIAIHATDAVAELGRPASHGCAHVDDAAGHWLLAHIPDGTPVVIENAPFHRGRGSPA